jgi:Ca-activated chloride channel family protein
MTGLLHPEWVLPLLVALAVVALAVLTAAWSAGRRRRSLLGAGPRLPGLARDAALLVSLLCVGLAALGPRLGERTEQVTVSGVDLVVLLDVSRSMQARDVMPSRLERARRNAELVLAGLEPGDRAALAAFAGRGVLLTPLTPDLTALLDVLPSIDTELMRLRGSSLGEGVRAAIAAYDPASQRPRVLLVLGDGEDPAMASDDGSTEAARAGVRIVGVALGSEAGSTIPDHDVPLRDAHGEIVRTRRNLERLSRLAAATGGRILATDAFGAIDAKEAVAEIRRDTAAAPGESVTRRVAAVQVVPFAAIAFALLVWEALASVSIRLRLRGGARALRTTRSTLLCGALLFTSTPSRAATDGAQPGRDAQEEQRSAAEIAAWEVLAERTPQDPNVLVGLGLARARAGLGSEASRAFLAAALYARDPALASLAYFDLGVTALGRGELEVARDAFFDALALAPGDDEARFNLEWALRALREVVPPPAPRGLGPSNEMDRKPSESADPRSTASGASDSREPGAKDEQPESSGGDARPSPGGAPSAAEGTPSEAAAEQRAAADAASGAQAPALEQNEAARWLDAVQDDPGRALRDAARRAGGGERSPERTPGW